MKREERNRADFLPDQIRDQKNDDENMDEQIVISKIAQPGVTGCQSADYRGRHRKLVNRGLRSGSAAIEVLDRG